MMGLVGVILPLWGAVAHAAPSVDPTIISELSLDDEKEGSERGLILSPPSARALLEKGAPLTVLHLSDRAVRRRGIAQTDPEWLALKADTLIFLERWEAALQYLEGLPVNLLDDQPSLSLALARVYLALGQWEKARQGYVRFLLNHGDHPGRFEAQRGIGWVALEAGRIEEASLLLGLYEQDAFRPRSDPLLTISLARLSRLKGDVEAEKGYYAELSDLILPDHAPDYRARIKALALWHRRNQRWGEAFSLAEEGLKKEPSPPFCQFYQRLLQEGLAAYRVRSKGADESVLTWVHLLVRGGAAFDKREAALETLLKKEDPIARCLFHPRSGLVAGSFLSYPVDPSLRLLLARAFYRQNRPEWAWSWLIGLDGVSVVRLRLQLLADGYLPDSLPPIASWQHPFPVDDETVKGLTKAMFALTHSRQLLVVAQLRRLLSPLSQDIAVRRALGYQQALDRLLGGEPPTALTLFLELAEESANKGASTSEINALLPQPPLEAAAEILGQQGAPDEAAELRRLQNRSHPR